MVAAVAGNARPVLALKRPTHASVSFSDYCAINTTSVRARFTRPTVDGYGFETANPGARMRFVTNSALIRVQLHYTNLVTRMDTYNGYGAVLADGAVYKTFNVARGDTRYTLQIDFPTTASRTIEIVMPYCASVDCESINVLPGATFSAAAARSSTRMVCIGDSITHGFSATSIDKTWPFLLAQAKGWQLINHGYGGRVCTPADGTAAANLSPSVATLLIGYNDFNAQTALATFKANYKALINNFRAVAGSSIKLHCINLLWSPNTNTLTLANYRAQITDALTELANANNVLIDGTALATNNVSSFPDTIHPNDTGSAEIATALTSLVSV